MPEITCHCGKKRWMAPCQIARVKGKPTCSKACRAKSMVGRHHWNWTGGKYTDGQGYVRVRRDGKYEYEHVVVAREKLGRALRHNERVRHKDGDRTNNRPGNLEVFTIDIAKRPKPRRPRAAA
jgi:hypothetical protein